MNGSRLAGIVVPAALAMALLAQIEDGARGQDRVVGCGEAGGGELRAVGVPHRGRCRSHRRGSGRHQRARRSPNTRSICSSGNRSRKRSSPTVSITPRFWSLRPRLPRDLFSGRSRRTRCRRIYSSPFITIPCRTISCRRGHMKAKRIISTTTIPATRSSYPTTTRTAPAAWRSAGFGEGIASARLAIHAALHVAADGPSPPRAARCPSRHLPL